jgi:hypothetical protein
VPLKRASLSRRAVVINKAYYLSSSRGTRRNGKRGGETRNEEYPERWPDSQQALKSLAASSASPMSCRTGELAFSVREDAREAGLGSEGFQSLGPIHEKARLV